MNRQIWQEPSEPALRIKSLLRAGISIELLGADKTEIEPGGILATGLIGIRFVDSFIASVSVLLQKWRERWKRHLE